MTKLHTTLLLFIILAPSLYFLLTQKKSRKPIKIEPIKVSEITTSKVSKAPTEILSQLKVATQTAKSGIKKDKEEVARSLLDSLEEKIVEQKIEEIKPISQTVPLKQTKSVPKQKLTQKVIHKKVVHKKVVHKKVVHKKVVQKKKTLQKKRVKVTTTKKVKQKMPKKMHLLSKKTKEVIAVNPKRNCLTREEEVALCEKKYGYSLEVVNISKPFEIKEKSTIPDEKYFEPIETVKEENPNAPLKFVKTLGVVAVSNKYEADFEVPKKVEVAKEGIVSVPSATVETEEIKKLKFVDTLGVVEVSKEFESIKAKN